MTNNIAHFILLAGAPTAVKSFRTVLPASSKNVYYRDDIGNISTSNLRYVCNNSTSNLRIVHNILTSNLGSRFKLLLRQGTLIE